MFKVFGNAVAFIAFGLGVVFLAPNAHAGAKPCAAVVKQGVIGGCNGGTCPLTTPTCGFTYGPGGVIAGPTGCACF